METDPPAKILIVDDEPFNVDLLEQELADLGYHTISASNGKEALEKVAAEAPDLILLDVMMPGMNGLTVCRILKEQEETQLIPVVIMTALGATEDRIKGIEAGADDFLTKPVDHRELRARIQTALKMKRAVDRKIERQAVPDNTFRLEGEYWTIAYQGTVVRAKDTTGLRYLAYLLRHPYQQIHVLELVRLAGGPIAGVSADLAEEKDAAAFPDLRVQLGLGDAGEILDPKAKAAYKQRLKELQTELEDAQAGNDVGRAAKAQQDIEFLAQELQRAIGLKGRDRRAASPAEQARVNVQRAIHAALKRLSVSHSALEHYLAGTIHTGMHCSYTPKLDIPSPWQL
jgi:DNA-binding response OmpR family regulator